MTRLVLDASIIAKWFHSEGENHLKPARALRQEFEAGELTVYAPTLLGIEIINIAGRRWKWTEEALLTLAITFESLDFIWTEPDLSSLAPWIAKGLSTYDACYAAVSESEVATLITDDRRLLEVASEIAVSLESYADM